MKLASPWQPHLSPAPGKVFERLVAALMEDIGDGRLAAGTRLPPHREVAHALQIAVGTVTKAFAVLERRGVIASVRGRATFVTGATPPPTGVVDLSVNVPPVALSNRILAATLAQIAKRLDASAFSTYQPAIGRTDQRAAMARWIGQGKPDISPDRLLLTNGAQHALAIAFSVLAVPGGTILTEAETYPGAISIARLAGYRLTGIALDEEGIHPQALDLALYSHSKRGDRAIVYVTPTLHNPTARSMGEARRRTIVDICRRHNAFIIEDEIYAIIADRQLSPLIALAPERTLHVNGLSKTVCPGLRIGALVTPADLYERAVSVLQATSTMASPMTVAIMDLWLGDGTAESLSHSIRSQAQRRTRLACDLLGVTAPAIPGFHLWLNMEEAEAERLRDRASQIGIFLTPPRTTVASEGGRSSGLRICLGGPTYDELIKALNGLATLLRHTTQSAHSISSIP